MEEITKVITPALWGKIDSYLDSMGALTTLKKNDLITNDEYSNINEKLTYRAENIFNIIEINLKKNGFITGE